MKFAKRSTKLKLHLLFFAFVSSVKNNISQWRFGLDESCLLEKFTESRLKILSSPIELRSYVGMWSEMKWFSDKSTVLKIRNPCDSKCKHPQFIRSGRYLVLPVIITPRLITQTPRIICQHKHKHQHHLDVRWIWKVFRLKWRTCYVCIMSIFF